MPIALSRTSFIQFCITWSSARLGDALQFTYKKLKKLNSQSHRDSNGLRLKGKVIQDPDYVAYAPNWF